MQRLDWRQRRHVSADAAPTLWSRTIDRPGGRFLAVSSMIVLAIVVLAIASLR
jgi:quinoprotein glucose dehydrogenase